MIRLFLIFAVVTAGMALFLHTVSQEGLPWWPDTAIIASMFGALVAFSVYRFDIDARGYRRMWGLLKARRALRDR
jgi:hypothetical protein